MYTTGSIANGLSDHDEQLLELHVINLNSKRNNYKTITVKKKTTLSQLMNSKIN